MSDIAIRVENLGKQYRIGKRERYKTLRDTLSDAVTAPFRRLRRRTTANGKWLRAAHVRTSCSCAHLDRW